MKRLFRDVLHRAAAHVPSSRAAAALVLCLTLAVAAGSRLLLAQAADAEKILADARAALGGEKKLAGLRTFLATGQSVRVVDEQSQPAVDAEVAFEAPDKYVKKDGLSSPAGTFTRTSGMNGETLIDGMDQPPAMAGRVIIRMGSGAAPPGVTLTPEQQEEARQRTLLARRQEWARMTLGMLLPSLPALPLQYTFAGQAESPDGKADVIDVTGEGAFAVRLFIDTRTHLPLMLSWMAREPMRMTTVMRSGGPEPGGRATAGAGGNAVVIGAGAAGAQGRTLTPEERDTLLAQAEQQRKEAEAKLRIVEYRLFYGDYRTVDGIKVPFRLQQSIDGKPVEEVTFEKVKINETIDPAKFQPSKQ